MMKSIALTESLQHDEEFVIVEAFEEPDEDSYDYCDDAYSVPSVVQSLSVNAGALQTFQEDFFERHRPPASILLQEAKTDEESVADEPSEEIPLVAFISVSAAFNVQDHAENLEPPEPPYTALDILSDFSALSFSEKSPAEEMKEAPSELEPEEIAPVPSVKVHVESLSSRLPSTTTPASEEEEEKESANTEGCCSLAECKNNSPRSSFPAGDSIDASALDVEEKLMDLKNSRASNRKRRKKLRLAKKAAAAAAAAASLSQMTRASSTRPSSSARGKNVLPLATSRAKKKKQVANIAAACATESYKIYRNEVRQSSRKAR